MRHERIFLLISLLGLGTLSACGDGVHEGEFYGDLLSSPQGLVLTLEEHGDGWGRADCFMCHPIQNLHLANQTSFAGIDMDKVRYITATQGEAGCSQCHGFNGGSVSETTGFFFRLKNDRR